MRGERLVVGPSGSAVQSVRSRTTRGRTPANGDQVVTARLSLSAQALARMLSASGTATDWILSSVDGSTTVKARLAIASVPDAALTVGKRQVELDWARSLLTLQGRQVTLTRMELRLLGALLEFAPDTAPRVQLIERLWPSCKLCRESEGALSVWIHALRRRFGALGITDAIRTVRATGYSLSL